MRNPFLLLLTDSYLSFFLMVAMLSLFPLSPAGGRLPWLALVARLS